MFKYIIASIVMLIVFSGCSSKTYMTDGTNKVQVKQLNSSMQENKTIISPIGKYEGMTTQGMANGKGKYTWNSGESYDGNYQNGLKNGKGTFTWADGTTYVGSFQNGLRYGYGVQVSKSNYKMDGDFYKGQCLKCKYKMVNKPNGVASILGDFSLDNSAVNPKTVTLTYNDGTTYTGIVNSQFIPDGNGYKIINNGMEKISALWFSGKIVEVKSKKYTKKYFTKLKKDEKCKLLSTEWIYIGDQCKDNLASGKGTAINFSNNKRFEGIFKEGQFDNGTLFMGQDKIVGNWRNGKLNGKSTSFVNNKIKYEGEYKDGEKHGKGVCLYNNEYESCTYFYDKRVDSLYKQRILNNENEKQQKVLAKQQKRVIRNNTAQTKQKSTGEVVGNALADCAKGLVAKKVCERIPWPGSTICMATVRSKYPCVNLVK